MRKLTPQETSKVKFLTEKSIEFTLIEPTSTGLSKSILDATGPIRTFLKTNDLHNYELQKQGQEHKIKIKSFFINTSGLTESDASLYRPNTKNGDPRIWFSGLNTYANPNDILAIFTNNQKLFIINLTKLDIIQLFYSSSQNQIQDLLIDTSRRSNEVAMRLLQLLYKIGTSGPIPAQVNADTAVGRTLETLLGISINSSKKPDYFGIELKSFRDRKGNRKNLFAQVPDWDLSKFKSSAEILNEFGYERNNTLKLYCTVSAKVRNSQGLKLKINNNINQLIENSNKSGINDFAIWRMENLHKRLLEKHNETFWIAADSISISGKEHFIYKKVEHTKKPILSQFEILIEQGIITLDHLIKKNEDGKVIEKGPIFKIKPNALGLLFPPSEIYNLNSI